MNVLSLFDGMSCGQLALVKAGIKYDKYFASEVDKFACKVSSDNFPNTIHIGDVEGVSHLLLPKIDLLIGGSPCQGFSFSGKMLNFQDPRSKLFFEYVRLKEEVQPKYFLLENVVMKKEYQDVISSSLGVNPIRIDSKDFSAQKRARLYWTNIPVKEWSDAGIKLPSILELSPEDPVFISKTSQERFERYGVKILDGTEDKARCLAAMEYIKNGKQGNYLRVGSRIRKLTVTECKRLQTVPDDYKMEVSNSQAYKMLGNGWTVDVIAHILRGIL